MRKIQDFTLKTLTQLDILVNNAGIFPKKGWLQSSPQEWQDIFNINVISMVRMIQAFLPQMKDLGWGRIIQIASVAGISPSPDLPAYGATKAANINMTISLAKELTGTGITVNTVSPGPIATKGTVLLGKIGVNFFTRGIAECVDFLFTPTIKRSIPEEHLDVMRREAKDSIANHCSKRNGRYF